MIDRIEHGTLNKTWVTRYEACPVPVKRFFNKYPKGLKITKRNILKALDEGNVSFNSVWWFMNRLLRIKFGYRDDIQFDAVADLARTPFYNRTRSKTKQLVYINEACKVLGIKYG
jgi:hypothetical protein